MSIANSIKTVLIVGATSGLGEQFARRLHALGKKVIITGRRTERLSSIKSDLKSNVETYEWDITDLSKTTSRASEIVAAHPDIDSIFLVAGFANFFNYLNPSSSTDEKIIAECTTNVTAQALLTRIFLPHLASVATKGQPASYVFVGSGMGFAPNALFPLYASTKAQTHHFAVALRQGITKNQTLSGNLSIVEIVAPYVATDFDKGFRSPHGPQPMPLDEFMGDAMAQLEKPGPDGKPPKEIAVGTAQPRVDLWRNSVGKFLKDSGMDD